jgi:hypothetical protein
VRAYLRQQVEYGKAEALLERKWPERYNRGGHLAWEGRMYAAAPRRRRGRIGYGTWGSNLFQSLYDRTPSTLGALPLMPEWYLLIGLLGFLSIIGIFRRPVVPWTSDAPVRVELLLLAVAILALVIRAIRSAWHAPDGSAADGTAVRSVAAALFLIQPVARLIGRLRGGLTPWRRRGELGFAVPRPRRQDVWSERWRSQTDRLLELESDLRNRCMIVTRGGDTDRWDIQVRVGPLGSARLRIAVEEHGQGRQLVRYRVWPRWSRALPALVVLLVVWFAGSLGQDYLITAAVGVTLALILGRAFQEAGAGVALVLRAVGDEVEVDEAAADPPDLMADLRLTSEDNGVGEQRNGSPVPVSLRKELR